MVKAKGKVTVTTSGTPVRLTINETDPTARVACHAFMVEAWPTNTGKMYVMDRSNGVIATGVGVVAILAIPTSNILPVFTAGFSSAPNAFNLANYYVDADTNGEAVLVSILEL